MRKISVILVALLLATLLQPVALSQQSSQSNMGPPEVSGEIVGEAYVYKNSTVRFDVTAEILQKIPMPDSMKMPLMSYLVASGTLEAYPIDEDTQRITGSLTVEANESSIVGTLDASWHIVKGGDSWIDISMDLEGLPVENMTMKKLAGSVKLAGNKDLASISLDLQISLYRDKLTDEDLQNIQQAVMMLNNQGLLNMMLSQVSKALYVNETSASMTMGLDSVDIKVKLTLLIDINVLKEEMEQQPQQPPIPGAPMPSYNFTAFNFTGPFSKFESDGTFSLKIENKDGKSVTTLNLDTTVSYEVSKKYVEDKDIKYVAVPSRVTGSLEVKVIEGEMRITFSLKNLRFKPVKPELQTPEALVDDISSYMGPGGEYVGTPDINYTMKIYVEEDGQFKLVREFKYTPAAEIEMPIHEVGGRRLGVSTIVEEGKKVRIIHSGMKLVELDVIKGGRTIVIINVLEPEQYDDPSSVEVTPPVKVEAQNKLKVKFKMYYDPARLKELGIAPEDLRLAYWADGKWHPIESTVNPSDNSVSAELESFSIWCIVYSEQPSETATTPTETTTTPTPTETETTTSPTPTETTPTETTPTETTPTTTTQTTTTETSPTTTQTTKTTTETTSKTTTSPTKTTTTPTTTRTTTTTTSSPTTTPTPTTTETAAPGIDVQTIGLAAIAVIIIVAIAVLALRRR